MKWACLVPIVIIITLFFVGLLGAVSFMAGGANGEGEQITSEGGFGPSSDVGTVSDKVPDILVAVFKEAGAKYGVPAALLAAISNQECNQLWAVANSNPELVQSWITSNTDVDRRGCGYDNGFRVWGPMQFQDTTFGIGRGEDPRPHPIPRPGSFGAQAGTATGHQPPSMLNIRDVIYAAAIKLYKDSGKSPNEPWSEFRIRLAAKHYMGACDDVLGGKAVHYCDDIARKFKLYSGTIGQ